MDPDENIGIFNVLIFNSSAGLKFFKINFGRRAPPVIVLILYNQDWELTPKEVSTLWENPIAKII